MLLLTLALSCKDIACGPGTVLDGDTCLPTADTMPLSDSGGTDGTRGMDSGQGTDTGDTSETRDPQSCDPIDLWSVGVENDPALVTQSTLEILLTAVSEVQVQCTLTGLPDAWAPWVPAGSTWSYLDTGEDPGADWAEPSFDDSGWAQGPAPLGYGDAQATLIDWGDDTEAKHTTTWFRHRFAVDDPAALKEARLRVQRDDGVRVLLNGAEVLRDNLPDGDLTADTLAVGTASGGDETSPVTGDLDVGLLVAGENVLAVEVHQASLNSSDLNFELELQVRAPGQVDADAAEVHVLRSAGPAPVHDFLLQGLLADATYTCDVTTSCPGAPASFDVETGPLPDRLPELEVRVPAADGVWGDYTLVNHGRPCGGDDQNRLLIVDHQGRIRWYFELEGLDQGSTIDLESQYLGDGRIGWGGGDRSEGSPQLIDLSGEILYTAAYEGAEDHVYHHDVQVTDDGRFMGLINTSDGAAGKTWEGFALIEHDPVTLEVTWSWYSQDAVEAGELATDGSRDPWHANSFAIVEDAEGEGVYVSFLTTEEIVRIDRATGAVSWSLGVGQDFALVDSAGAAVDEAGWFGDLHAIDVTADGDLMVYDNGQGRDASRAVRYELDTASRQATLAWSYAEPGWYEPIWGDADQLDNHNVLINMAHAWCWGGSSGHWGSLVELDPADNTPLWRVDWTAADDSSYRAQKLDGCEVFQNATACPELLE